MAETVILKIDPPLPCAVLQGSGTCDRPARMVYAYPTRGPRLGVWLIMPICDLCAGTGSSLDDGGNHTDEEQRGPKPDVGF